MGLIENVIKIEIVTDAVGVVRKDFGTVLVLGNSVPDLAPQVKSYASLDEVAEDFDNTTMPEYIAAARLFGQAFKMPSILIGQKKASDASYAAAYTAIKNITQDFWSVDMVTGTNDDKFAVSTAVQTEKRLFSVSTQEAGALTDADGNIMKRLALANHERSTAIYTSNADEDSPFSAWLGQMLPLDAGSATWIYTQLNGVRADNLTDAQITAIKSRNGNFYSPFGPRNATFFGTTATGVFIDVLHGLDWLEYITRFNIANLFTTPSLPKVPYTRDGLALIENAIRASFAEAQQRNLISEYTITMPDYDTIPSADKIDRILRNIVVDGTLTGAIHGIDKIRMTITP